jgi:nicotinate phosphoribosyltransferase
VSDDRGRPRYPFLPGVVGGETADVYFLRTRDVLCKLGRDPSVAVAIFAGGTGGTLAGVDQTLQILGDAGFDGEIWALADGESFEEDETVLTIRGRYSSFGIYETAILGILSSSTGWATAARECVEAAGSVPVVSFGARHIHPNVAPIMDAVAVMAGCTGCSTPLGAALSGVTVSGTMPHAYILIMEDTVDAALAFDADQPPDVPRIVLVDTFNDEAVESVRVAERLGDRLEGVRLDTPAERGGVTVELIQEVRARLDLRGFGQVSIFVSGGMTPARIHGFVDAPARVDGFGVGSYIAGARPIDFTADIREIEGQSVAKRGRIPGLGDTSRLRVVFSTSQ